jgi:DNA-binding response OmpR family regulator
MPTVMIAEDDLYMADMLEEVLVDSGYDVCGIASTVDKAVELGERHKPDLAILDIRLAGGGLGTEIPARLKGQGRMGVLYASWHAGQVKLTKTDGDALLVKPYRPEDAVRALKVVETVVSTDLTLEHLPRGFSLLGWPPKTDKPMVFADAGLTSQINRLRRQQTELARFGTFALGDHESDDVFMEAARISAECLDAPYATIYQYRPGVNDLLADAGFGWNQGVIGRVVSRADGSSPCGRAFVNRGPVICDDLVKDKAFVPSSHYAEHGIVSTANVVIGNDHQPGRRPYGVLEIASPVLNACNSHDIDFLTGIANILAQAIAAAERNAALNDAADRLRDMDEDKTNFLGAKNGPLGEKNELLKRLMDQISWAEAHRSDHG